MKILVTVKSVPDHEARIKVKDDGTGIQLKRVKWIVNPFDEIAVEEALRLYEAGIAREVAAVSIGPQSAAKELRHALAMGVQRAILVRKDDYVDSDFASQIIAAIFKRENFDLVLMGKQSIDSDANQTAQLLAARLNLPQGCFISKIKIEKKSATLTREVDGGLETIRVGLPAVISVDLRLNEPRYALLPGLMRAKKMPIEELTPRELGVDSNVKIKILKLSPAPRRAGGKLLGSARELVKILHEEAGVI